MKPKQVLSVSRRVTLVLSLIGLGYLYWRYELTRMSESGCSPLLRFSPGAPLLVDKRPSLISEGDAIFFQGPDGRLYLANVGSEREGGYWVEVDNPDCTGSGSETLGVVPPDRVRGRVLVAFSSR